MTEHSPYSHKTTAFDVRCRRSHLDASIQGGPGEPEVEHVILADAAGAAALRQFFASVDVDACRYPITVALEFKDAALAVLLDHGVPPAELHATLVQLEARRREREHLSEFLPPQLVGLYTYLGTVAGTPATRFIRALRSGAPWGYPQPIVLVGKLPHSREHYLMIDTADPDVLVIGRDPAWAGGMPRRELRLSDPEHGTKVMRLLAESDKERPERDEDWGESLEMWAIEARSGAGVAPWEGEVDAQCVHPRCTIVPAR